MKSKLEKLTIERLLDEFPDITELASLDDPESKKRHEAFVQEQWCMLYVQVKAEILVPVKAKVQNTYYNYLQTITSPGVYNIESDSDEELFLEYEMEELETIKSMLEALNVDTSNWDKILKAAVRKYIG